MKKFFCIVLLISITSALQARAEINIQTAPVTIFFNPNHQAGHFVFDIKVNVDGVFEDYTTSSFDTTPDSNMLSILVGPLAISNQYEIIVTHPNGSVVDNIDCSNNDPSDNFAELQNGIIVSLNSTTAFICNFSGISQTKNPLLIVPGILGTDLQDSDGSLLWANEKMTLLPDSFMDDLSFNSSLQPISQISPLSVIKSKVIVEAGFHYTDKLFNDLKSQGYSEGENLFTFPYDWRYGVSDDIISQLKQKIQDIQQQTGSDKVDVVAHSTGGLIVKKYIQENSANSGIGKLVMVGVPNLGSPKDIKVLLQGDNFNVIGLSDSEMKKIALNMPVAYVLSPTEKYFSQAGSSLAINNQLTGSGPTDLNFDDTWTWLEQHGFANGAGVAYGQALNTPDFENFDLANSGVDLYNIVGCTLPTFSKIQVNITKEDSGFNFTDLKLASGDGTVPLASSASIGASTDRTFYARGIGHGNLLSSDGSRQEIVNLISGSNLSVDPNEVATQSDLDSNPSLCNIPKGKFLGIFSPVAISITDQVGNQAQVLDNGSIDDEIPGVDYEVFGEHKFVYLPTDAGQTYTVDLQGTGTGTFTLQESDFDNGNLSNTQSFSNVPVTPDMSGSVNLADAPTLEWNNQTLTPGDYTPQVSTAPVPDPAPAPQSEPTGPSIGGGNFTLPAITLDAGGQVWGISTLADRTLVLDTSDGRTVYMIWHGKKYGFTSDQVFLASRFSFADLISDDLSNVPPGGLF